MIGRLSTLSLLACIIGTGLTVVGQPRLPNTGWHALPYGKARLSRPNRQSLLFSAPQWDGLRDVWPAMETSGFPKDWSSADRLAIPILCASTGRLHQLTFFISDSTTPFRKGARFVIPPFTGPSAQMLVLPIREQCQKKNINLKDISIIHCFTKNPPRDFKLHLGPMTLLAPNAPVPALPQPFTKALKQLQFDCLKPILQRIRKLAETWDDSKLSAEDQQCFTTLKHRFLERLDSGALTPLLLANPKRLPMECHALPNLLNLLKLPPQAGNHPSLLLGFAHSTDKVLPQAPIFSPLPQTIELSAAGNEAESFQLVLLPKNSPLNQVTLRPSAFTSETDTLPSTALSIIPVGFVKTTFVPLYGPPYLGFWPDPLLTFLDKTTINANEAQPFWIKLSIPEHQAPGRYQGTITILSDGQERHTVQISLLVRNFSLPSKSMLPLAVTFYPQDNRILDINPTVTAAQRNHPDAPVNAWKKHTKQWRNMLESYYLSLDSLYDYPNREPDWDHLLRQKQRGCLNRFNLGYFHFSPNLPRLRRRYAKAKELNLLEHAYVYACDEVESDKFHLVKQAAEAVRKQCPDVTILTTSYDDTYGLESPLNCIDGFCPVTSSYNATQALKARQQGKQIWWYICMLPRPPYANVFVESPAMEIRLLMGAMAAKYRPDGFLYYATAKWNHTTPITTGPYTTWDAQSFPGCNGDGNWCYPGPDSTPLPTIRLENFRDGLEDYAYVKCLEEKLQKAQALKLAPEWQNKAKQALTVPPTLVQSMKRFSLNRQQLEAWRASLAELLEQSPHIP